MPGARTTLAALGLAIASLAVLPGCLRTTPPPASAEDSIELPEGLNLSEADRARLRAYMRAVEARAERRHMVVYWVHPPDGSARADLNRLEQLIDGQPPLP